jgi:hypothetical protein
MQSASGPTPASETPRAPAGRKPARRSRRPSHRTTNLPGELPPGATTNGGVVVVAAVVVLVHADADAA